LIFHFPNECINYQDEDGSTCMWNLHDGILIISTVTMLEIPKFSRAPRIRPQVNVAYYKKLCKSDYNLNFHSIKMVDIFNTIYFGCRFKVLRSIRQFAEKAKLVVMQYVDALMVSP